MFLKSIHIKNYNQFENLELDLTYPKGHAKAGEPLEKICIIGDNGTGKTTILEILNYVYENTLRNSINQQEIVLEVEGNPDAKIICRIENLDDSTPLEDFKLIYFPVGPNLSTISSQSAPKNNRNFFINPFEKRTVYARSNSTEISNRSDSIFNLSDRETFKTWNLLKENIKNSINKELAYRRGLLKGMSDQNEAEIDEVYKKFKAYKKDNPNGYDDFAKFLNPLLKKFHLKLNTRINLDKFNEVEFLSLLAKDGTVVPIELWSTGVKHLIYTMLPLYAIRPTTGVVLFDEPENCLYPSTQRLQLNLYKSLCPDMQLIFATHSPVLASSFESWEVVELRFNENGKVERKPYYKGENHVDNYHIHPMYLTWNSLFMDMFGVNGESNDARTKKLVELAILDREVKLTDDKAKKKELFKKYEKIAEQLDWGSIPL